MSDPKDFIPRTRVLLGEEEKEAINRVINSGTYVKGPEVEKFEKEFAEYCGVKYAVAVNSGTSALLLALFSIELKPHDKVITVPNTFIATTNAIVHAGGVPDLVDVNPRTMNMDINLLEEKINSNSKVVIPVHLYGCPVEMDQIMELAEEKDLIVLEDAAQAHGAEYKREKIGSLGHIAAFSFYPTKNLTVGGDGGMITTNNEEYAEKARMLRNHGRETTFNFKYIGFNFRLSEILGAIGRCRLTKLDSMIVKRRKIAKMYQEGLSDLTQVELPCEPEHSKHVYYLYVPKFNERNSIKKFLENRGIQSVIDYPMTINQMKPYQERFGFKKDMFLYAEKLVEEILAIPMFPELNNLQIERIISEIRNFYEG